MAGGIDKRVLAAGKDAIDDYLERIIPAMVERGGYIPTCDHGVPDDVSLRELPPLPPPHLRAGPPGVVGRSDDMARARMGDRVVVHYTGALADGAVFDTTRDGEPLAFTLGGQEVIPGFEGAVVGLEPGETRTTIIPAADAYGLRREELVAHVERARFPGKPAFKVGQQLKINQQDGQTLVATIVAVTPTTVELDANHPLAGKDLTYSITLVSIAGGHSST